MGEPSTAMRDPVFYRLHAYINDMFLEFKATLPGYTAESVKNLIPAYELKIYSW